MTDLLNPAPKTLVADLARRLSGPDGLAPLSARRLSLLIELMDEAGYIGYAAAYSRLFPDSDRGPAEKTKADKAFHKFRQTLREAAAMHKTHLELQLDANRNADPAQRRFWFAAADDAEERLTEFNWNVTDPRLLEHVQGPTMRVKNEEFSYLLLYAEEEGTDAHKLHSQLRTQIEAAEKRWGAIDFHRDIPVGEDRERIRAGYLKHAKWVLLLVSTALIAKIKKEELPPLPADRLIPLTFKGFDDDWLTGTLLADLQIFRDSEGKAWNQRRDREAWAAEAARAILPRMDQLHDPAAAAQKCLAAITRFSADYLGDCPASHYVEQQLCSKQSEQGDAEGREALPFLLNWLRRPLDGLPYCAIFGELGMGKTTLSQRLTRRLLELRKTEPGYPLPVYLDLRVVNAMNWDWRTQGVPPLDNMIAHLLASAYNIPVGQARPSVEDIKRLVQEQGGLVIFDGLDEVMNHLPPDQCHHFIQRLWEILPPWVWRRADPDDSSDPDRSAPDGRVGRLIMTCRSHFFQTLREQISALSGHQHEAVDVKDYLWVTLLPFGPDQVETYFHQVFAAEPERAELVLEMLDRVHDLRGLSSRPYNLRLIRDQVEALEAIHRGGGRISVADLYEGMVDQWTDRDSPKHRLNRDYKLRLMEQLAHRLWSRGQKSLDYRELEDWLLDQLDADPRASFRHQAFRNMVGGLDILQEDLRNATFLVREGEDRFRFAHTSIMEFFLARALFRALLEIGEQGGDSASTADQAPDPEQTLAAWKIPIPSPETLDFLGELLRKRDQAVWQTAFRPSASGTGKGSASWPWPTACMRTGMDYPHPAWLVWIWRARILRIGASRARTMVRS